MCPIYCTDAILEPGEEILAHSDLIGDRGIPRWELDEIMVDPWRSQRVKHAMNCPEFPISYARIYSIDISLTLRWYRHYAGSVLAVRD